MNEIDLARKALDEAERQVAKYRERVAELEKKPGVWKPGDGDVYYFYAPQDSSGVGVRTKGAMSHSHICDKVREETGNVFPTKEAAQRYVEKLKIIQELRELAGGFVPDWGNLNAKHFILQYRHSDMEWYVTWYTTAVRPNFVLPSFKDRESAQAAIDKLGDRLNVLLEG